MNNFTNTLGNNREKVKESNENGIMLVLKTQLGVESLQDSKGAACCVTVTIEMQFLTIFPVCI